MPYRSLRDFLTRLEKDGALVRVKEPVSTVLEMTEIQTRLLATGGPAVLFEKPILANGQPSPMPAGSGSDMTPTLLASASRAGCGSTCRASARASPSMPSPICWRAWALRMRWSRSAAS